MKRRAAARRFSLKLKREVEENPFPQEAEIPEPGRPCQQVDNKSLACVVAECHSCKPRPLGIASGRLGRFPRGGEASFLVPRLDEV